MKKINKNHYIVRGEASGVYFGEIAKRDGQEVTMYKVRNIWRWRGANSLIDIANGADINNDFTRITPVCEEIILIDVCEIIPISEEVFMNLQNIEAWTKL